MGKRYMVYNNQLWEPYETFEYSGHLEELTLEPDTYLFVANGARGGNAPKNGNQFISWGGTTYGILDLDHTQTFYVNVGGNGGDSTTGDTRAIGGYNGGGNGGLSGNRRNPNGCGGGGATDVRLSDEPNTYVEIPVVVPEESNLTQVEYISTAYEPLLPDPKGPDGNGGYYSPLFSDIITTNYYIKANSDIELMIELPEYWNINTFRYNMPFGMNMIFGASSEQGKATYLSIGFIGVESDYLVRTRIDDGWGISDSDVKMPWGQKVIIKLPANSSTLSWYTEDGIFINSVTANAPRVDTEYPMMIFQENEHGNGHDSGGPEIPPQPDSTCMRFYYMKIRENDEMVHWYVPVKETDTYSTDPDLYWSYGRGGIYDLVEEHYIRGTVKMFDNDPNKVYCAWLYGLPVAPEEKPYHHTKLVEQIPGADSRIMVAAGGGGTSIQYDTTNQVQDFNSFGGGASAGKIIGPGVDSSNHAGLRATQNTGYAFATGEHAEDRAYAIGAVNWGMEGQGGGGGGWYGGYAIFGVNSTTTAYSSYGGTGGSGYVLTDSSYKPEGYLDGYTDIMESLYFRNIMMIAYQAFDGPSFTVYKLAEQKPIKHDKIIVPFTGSWQKIKFLPTSYRIKCYGGDGGTRYDNSKASKGGYVEGVLNLPEARDLFLHVGASRYIIGTDGTNDILDQIYGGTQFKNFQASAIKTSSSDGIPEHSCAGGGSVDVRLEQTGNVPTIITVPDGYDEVEYVQSNGTQYIKTFTAISTSDFECVCEITNTGGSQCIFGVGINTTWATVYASGLAVYAIYDPADPQSAFLCKDQVFMNGSTMPFNQKIKIVINNNILEWYDMSGQLLGSITATERSAYTSNEITLFDVSNGQSGSSFAPSGLYSTAKIYSFKRIARSSGNIVNYLVPCISQMDPTRIGFYDLAGKSYYFKSGGDTFTCGQVVPKTEYMGTVSNTANSRLSRFIIAGGGGGQGSPIGLGGDGGGEEGEACKGTATYGSNKGPGKRTSGSSFEITTSGDAGGSAYVDGIKTYGGGGGYGWYSGYGTQNTVTVKMSSDDVNKGGSGGSSYVFSEETDQYKRSGYRVDTSYWMTDTKNILGGNPVRGMTRIEIDVLKVPGTCSVVAGDGTTFYGYDTSEQVWNIIPESELSDEVFNQYGVQIEDIVSDTNIQKPYKLYINNPDGLNIDRVYSHVVPFQPTLKVSDQIDGDIVSYIVDYDANRDEVDQITATYTTTPANDNIQKLDVDIVFDINDVPTTDAVAYMVEFKVDKKAESNYYPEQKPKVYGTMALCNTHNTSDNPYGYKPYIGDLMPDGITPIRTVDCSTAGIDGRDIYIAALLNNSIIRIVKYSTTEDKYYLVRDNIPRNQVAESTNCAGSLLVTDDKLYLLNSIMGTSGVDVVILEIPFDPEKQMKKHRSYEIAENVLYDANGLGQAFWIGEGNDRKILVRTMYGHLTFNVKTEDWDFTAVPNVQQNKSINSIAMGEHALVEFPYDEQTISPYLYSVDDYSPTTSPGYQMQAGVKYVCYDNGYFYIAQRGHLYIMEDSSTGTPKLIADIEIPDAILQPKQIICSNQIVYILFEDTNNAYTYNVKYQSWSHFMLPFVNPDIASANLYRPICMKGYFFLGNRSLFVINSGIETTYKIGRKLSSLTIPLNSNNGKQMIYNPEFITVDTVGAHCHDGYLMKTITKSEGENTIYETDDYKWNDYRKIFNYSFFKE